METLLPSLAWIYDGSPLPDPHGKGEAAVRFIRALRHPKSKLPGNAFDLSPWQERIVRRVFGDTLPDGTRRVNELFLMVGRGNRKTSLMAACLMLFLVGPERVPGSTIASLANSREQAALTFKEMAGICRATPRILEAVRIQDTEKRITYRRRDIAYEALSSDAKNAHGRTDVCAFWDEGHAEKKADLLEAMKPGCQQVAEHASPIGVDGRHRTDRPVHEYEHAKKIADGTLADNSFLPILFEAPADDCDWRSDDWLFATDPGLQHGYPNLAKLRRYRARCEHSPAERNSYRRLHLSIYLDGAAKFLEWDLAIWDENADEFDLTALEGARAWLGVDLSRQTDLTCVSACIEMPDGRYALYVQCFAPQEGIRRRADVDHAPYPLWAEAGLIVPCPGDLVDFDMVEQHILALHERFDLQEVAFDRKMAREIMGRLDNLGVPVVDFPQQLMTFAPAVNDFERLFMDRRLAHGGNPLMRWSMGNVVLWHDANNNRRPDKGRSIDRIDPVVASIMATSRAVQGGSTRSAYDSLEVEDLNF